MFDDVSSWRQGQRMSIQRLQLALIISIRKQQDGRFRVQFVNFPLDPVNERSLQDPVPDTKKTSKAIVLLILKSVTSLGDPTIIWREIVLISAGTMTPAAKAAKGRRLPSLVEKWPLFADLKFLPALYALCFMLLRTPRLDAFQSRPGRFLLEAYLQNTPSILWKTSTHSDKLKPH